MYLPAADEDCLSVALAPLSALSICNVERVGRWCGLAKRQRGVSTHSAHGAATAGAEDDDDDEDDEEATSSAATATSTLKSMQNDFDLMTLDPKNKKEQDHYAVLGLAHLRFEATEQDIKKAYKRLVLQHHPDKRGESKTYTREHLDAVFTCIKFAYEILSNADSRRAYDGVDPTFDESVPAASNKSKKNFYSVFTPVFARNTRWSKAKLPKLGDENSTFEEVDNFYSSWYEFQSTRDFSYLDKEDTDKAECREERRWLDKQNKAQRALKRKEEVNRIRTLVDNAYTCDPRIKRFKEEEKQKKADKKAAKAAAAKAAVDEQLRIQREKEEAERKQAEAEAEEARVAAEAAKKTRDAAKKAMQRERKAFRTACKSHNYFTEDDAKRISHMEYVERLCENMNIRELEELRMLVASPVVEDARSAFERSISKLMSQQEREVKAATEAAAKRHGEATASASKSAGKTDWSVEDMALLVKAVKSNPAGTVNRWDVIAYFVNQHSSTKMERSSKDCIAMTKRIQKDSSLKNDITKKAFERFDKEHGQAASRESVPTERTEGPSGVVAWTADEQKLLERAMKTIPSSDPDRWDKIAAEVGSRSVVEIKKRVKELVEKVKARKSAAPSK